MASAAFGDSDEDWNSKKRQGVNRRDIVYTRRAGKKACSNKSTASLSDNPAPVNPSGRETEISSSVLATTGATGVSVSSSAASSPVAALPSATIPIQVVAGTDVGQDHFDAPVTEISSYCELGRELREEQSISQEEAGRDVGRDHQLSEQGQHELPCSSNDRIEKNNANQSFERENREEATELSNEVDQQSEIPFGAQNDDVGLQENVTRALAGLSENNQSEHTEVGLAENPTENNDDGAQPLPGSTRGAQGDVPVDEPLVVTTYGDFIRFKLGKRSSKVEIKDLSQKLDGGLESVRGLFKQLETKELLLASCNSNQSNFKVSTNGNYISAEAPNTVDSTRVNPGVSPILHQEGRPIGFARAKSDVGIPRNLAPRPYNRQLSVALFDINNRPGEFVEKEKRTPKANQFYRNSEFLLGKDRLPPESNKRLKTSNWKKRSGDAEHAFRFDSQFDKFRNQVFRNCNSLLQRLMKHKHSWVFNSPVDVQGLQLFDYYDIIKHPMDLGTVKVRLSQSVYNSPREFADDVRLVFHNALTYNPKGQDVHTMAEELLQIFEERWAVIEMEYNEYRKYQLFRDGRLPTPTSRKPPNRSYYNPSSYPAPSVAGYFPSATQGSTYVSAPNTLYPQNSQQFDSRDPVAGDPQTRSHQGRTPAPKKPKAKDPDKRDMTPEEKQRLSKHLQDLPSEKLDAIVQIVKRRNTAVSQRDDEIEVDIDSVDPETLWELDRFVTNYKKSLSKNKRRAELLRARINPPNQNVAIPNTNPAVTGIRTEIGASGKSVEPSEGGEQAGRRNESSSSSSSSDSDSSSSDSDTDSSSSEGSDSPKT